MLKTLDQSEVSDSLMSTKPSSGVNSSSKTGDHSYKTKATANTTILQTESILKESNELKTDRQIVIPPASPNPNPIVEKTLDDAKTKFKKFMSNFKKVYSSDKVIIENDSLKFNSEKLYKLYDGIYESYVKEIESIAQELEALNAEKKTWLESALVNDDTQAYEKVQEKSKWMTKKKDYSFHSRKEFATTMITIKSAMDKLKKL